MVQIEEGTLMMKREKRKKEKETGVVRYSVVGAMHACSSSPLGEGEGEREGEGGSYYYV